MESGRRTRRGKERVAEVDDDELKEAQRHSEAIQRGLHARDDALLKSRREEEGQGEQQDFASTTSATTAASEKVKPTPPFVTPHTSEETVYHNLDIAQGLIANGQTLQASSIPIRLASIRIEGAKSLRPSFLAQLCRPYLESNLRQSSLLDHAIYSHRLSHIVPGQFTSIPSLLHLTNSIGSDLAALDLFSSIDAKLQPSSSSIISSNGGSSSSTSMAGAQEDVDIVLTCREKGNYFLKTSTDVGNGEGNATVQGRIRNCFGGAERLDLSATMGTKTRRAFNVSCTSKREEKVERDSCSQLGNQIPSFPSSFPFLLPYFFFFLQASLSSPLFSSAEHSLTLSGYALDRDLTSYASLIEGVRGARVALQSRPGGGEYGNHELGFDVMHRHLSRPLHTASTDIRRQAGHSIKSAISHLFTFDSRDDPFLATQGYYLKLFQEWAGFGGDARHYKVESEGQLSRCFGLDNQWAISVAAQAGLLRSLSARPPQFADRFQLGGPVSVRMFRFNSLGPKTATGRESLGGDAYYTLGLSLFAPIPTRPDWPLKLHSFCNMGQLVQMDPQQALLSATNRHQLTFDLLARPSSSVGVGLMYRQGGLRAEVNFGMPLTARAGDGARKGFQLGIGITFM